MAKINRWQHQNIGRDVRQLELTSTAGRNITHYNHVEKLFAFLINVYVSYDQGILLLDMDPKTLCPYTIDLDKNVHNSCVHISSPKNKGKEKPQTRNHLHDPKQENGSTNSGVLIQCNITYS